MYIRSGVYLITLLLSHQDEDCNMLEHVGGDLTWPGSCKVTAGHSQRAQLGWSPEIGPAP